MSDNKKRNMPKKAEEYKVKYVFDEESSVNINEIVKECFVIQLSNLLTK